LPDAKVQSFGHGASPWKVADSDLARQATASLRGYLYQLHQSAAAWIRLKAEDLLHLEVAEDYSEIIRRPGALDEILTATQVKNTREDGAVTLNSPDILSAVEALYRLQSANPGRPIRMVFLTTSRIGKERVAPLPSGRPGLKAWAEAANGGDVEELRQALLKRLAPGDLKKSILTSNDRNFRRKVLAPLTFLCDQRGWEELKADNQEALVGLRGEVRATAEMAEKAYDAIFSHLAETAISSATRLLDRQALIDRFQRATSIAVPSQDVVDGFSQPPAAGAAKPLDLEGLRALAEGLLEYGSPPSTLVLFPDAPPAARQALDLAGDLARTLVETDEAQGRAATRLDLADLGTRAEAKHLILAPPGTGKTHALWRLARRMLSDSDTVPLFLPVAQLTTWLEVVQLLAGHANGASVEAILHDPRVCICLDGWSEFASGEELGERRRALAALGRARLIANGKFAQAGDLGFKVWRLEPLSTNQVTDILARAWPGEPRPPDPQVDLFRLPLLLCLAVLSGPRAGSTGELLRQFHDHVGQGLPEAFTQVLAETVASLALSDDRSFGRLKSELQRRGQAQGVSQPLQVLERLGTIVDRRGQALPVHDLYWSWLAGVGLLTSNRTAAAIDNLATRESLGLALQSGGVAGSQEVDAAVCDDLILAAQLDGGRQRRTRAPTLSAALDNAFGDARLAVRCRAALAVFTGEILGDLSRGLDVLGDLSALGLYIAGLSEAIRPEILFEHRGALAEWIGSPGSEWVLGAIAARGGPEWAPWLEQMVLARRLDPFEALGVALACQPTLPSWGLPHFAGLVEGKPWFLRAAADRGVNIALAHHVASHYDQWAGMIGPAGGWHHLNRVLVTCADDAVFESLLPRFAQMTPIGQELLSYAIVQRGAPWISKFQKAVFAVPPSPRNTALADVVAAEIDDATARAWIAAGNVEPGWAVLISRHGQAMLPELIADLPTVYGDLHVVPALVQIGRLDGSPVTLIHELWRRFDPPVQPKVLQDLIYATATIQPEGVTFLVRFAVEQRLPLYHLDQVVEVYLDWRDRSGMTMMVDLPTGGRLDFLSFAVMSAVLMWEGHFAAQIVNRVPTLAVDVILTKLGGDEEKIQQILVGLKGLKTYEPALLELMLSRPHFASSIPAVFAEAFENFPAEAVERCLSAPSVDQGQLMFRLGATSNPLHRSAHVVLIDRTIQQPLDLHHCRYVANMLRAYPRAEVVSMLARAQGVASDAWLWLTREVEAARGQRLIDENGNLRA